MKDLTVCRDCYRYANENPEKRWFCKPCRPFHELVYARQKDFPYWPAKVMRVLDGEYDVRFFGGYHQRALVEKAHVKPITVNIHSLQVKRTSLWNKACEELRKHQELLEKVKQREDFLKEPYGDPFASEDLKAQLGAGTLSGEESSGSDSDDDTATTPASAPAPAIAVTNTSTGHPLPDPLKREADDDKTTDSPPKKKRGRPKKTKTELPPSIATSPTSSSAQPLTTEVPSGVESENQVSSSSPNFVEPKPLVSVAVQTPNKLLKGIILESGGGKNQSAAVQEAVKAAKKEFKQYAEKVRPFDAKPRTTFTDNIFVFLNR